MTSRLLAEDVVDVRLLDAMDAGGCVLCVVRKRAERGMLETIISERVLDIGFREGLERDHAFCRRHVPGLLEADRRSSGILGASILYGAIVARRLAALREAVAVRGRRRRARLDAARARPPCLACEQGALAAETAADRLAQRCADPGWAAAIGAIPLCLDDLGAFMAATGDAASGAQVVARQLDRVGALRDRLEGFAHHSAADRRHLLTAEERAAADEAARLLGG
ncbi:MAG: DUF6062 family protein [Chloroflexota bacterium]